MIPIGWVAPFAEPFHMEWLPWLLVILYLGGMALSYRIGLRAVYRRGLCDGLAEKTMEHQVRRTAYARTAAFYLLTALGLLVIDSYTATVIFGTSIVFSGLALPFFLILGVTVADSHTRILRKWLSSGEKP